MALTQELRVRLIGFESSSHAQNSASPPGGLSGGAILQALMYDAICSADSVQMVGWRGWSVKRALMSRVARSPSNRPDTQPCHVTV